MNSRLRLPAHFALWLVALLSVGCGSGSSPTEPEPSPTPQPTATPAPSPTPQPTATPAPSPTPSPGCAQLAGYYSRSIVSSTCIVQRVSGGPTVYPVSECTFEAYATVDGSNVRLEATGSTGTVTVVWPACQGKAIGTFTYDGSSIHAAFSGIVTGTDPSCCGQTTGSFDWLERRDVPQPR